LDNFSGFWDNFSGSQLSCKQLDVNLEKIVELKTYNELKALSIGVPVSYVETAGDPYKEEMEECVALIVAQLKRMGRESAESHHNSCHVMSSTAF